MALALVLKKESQQGVYRFCPWTGTSDCGLRLSGGEAAMFVQRGWDVTGKPGNCRAMLLGIRVGKRDGASWSMVTVQPTPLSNIPYIVQLPIQTTKLVLCSSLTLQHLRVVINQSLSFLWFEWRFFTSKTIHIPSPSTINPLQNHFQRPSTNQNCANYHLYPESSSIP